MSTFTYDENILSDLHRDAYGWRPREAFFNQWDAASNEGKQKIWDKLLVDLNNAIDADTARKNANFKKWESHILLYMFLYNVSKGAAIRWDMSSMGIEEENGIIDVGYYCYLWGIDYSHETEIEKCIKSQNEKEINPPGIIRRASNCS